MVPSLQEDDAHHGRHQDPFGRQPEGASIRHRPKRRPRQRDARAVAPYIHPLVRW